MVMADVLLLPLALWSAITLLLGQWSLELGPHWWPYALTVAISLADLPESRALPRGGAIPVDTRIRGGDAGSLAAARVLCRSFDQCLKEHQP